MDGAEALRRIDLSFDVLIAPSSKPRSNTAELRSTTLSELATIRMMIAHMTKVSGCLAAVSE